LDLIAYNEFKIKSLLELKTANADVSNPAVGQARMSEVILTNNGSWTLGSL
jgi:hypothetical protein